MKLFRILSLLIIVAACSPSGREEMTEAPESPGSLRKMLDRAFADPTVIKAADGKYYAYATNAFDADSGRTLNIQWAVSDDLLNWNHGGDALPDGAIWATGDYWAPHVIFDSDAGKYVMYYSAKSADTSFDKCLGVAVSNNPGGPFVDKGEPLLCGAGFVNIDPMAFDDTTTGKKLLYWGSGFAPIKYQELAKDRLSFKPGTEAQNLVFPKTESEYTNLIEGAWLDQNDEWYYMYYSGDNCCGPNAHYATLVARSNSPTGPFETYGTWKGDERSVVLSKKGKWLAPGHNSVVTDQEGQKWFAFHAIDVTDPIEQNVVGNDTIRYDKRVPLLCPLNYKDGWPVISFP